MGIGSPSTRILGSPCQTRTVNLVRSDTEKNRGNFIECDVTMEPREEGKITMHVVLKHFLRPPFKKAIYTY